MSSKDMNETGIVHKYELLSITFEQQYILNEESYPNCVCEKSHSPAREIVTIESDADGIPMGHSKEDIKIREKAIKNFYAKWIAENPEKKVWNINLNSYILVKYLSINETYNKAARSYESTKAVFQLTEILAKAQLVEELPAKFNNKNQRSFSKMLIMRYGNVKLTVGCQKTTNEKVQYSVTVPQK